MISHIQERKIEEVLGQFDFAKVHKVMEFLDWGWSFSGPDALTLKVPNEAKMVLMALGLLKNAVQLAIKNPNKPCTSGSGGFRANSTLLDDGYFSLELVFELDSSLAEIDPAEEVPYYSIYDSEEDNDE